MGSGLDQFISRVIPSYTVTLLLTCGTGRISDLTKTLPHELKERQQIELELRQHKETLEKQVEGRTEWYFSLLAGGTDGVCKRRPLILAKII